MNVRVGIEKEGAKVLVCLRSRSTGRAVTLNLHPAQATSLAYQLERVAGADADASAACELHDCDLTLSQTG